MFIKIRITLVELYPIPSQDKRAIKNESRIESVRFPQRLYAS
jgi:hypothetical protein